MKYRSVLPAALALSQPSSPFMHTAQPTKNGKLSRFSQPLNPNEAPTALIPQTPNAQAKNLRLSGTPSHRQGISLTQLNASPSGAEPNKPHRARYMRPNAQLHIHRAAAEASGGPVKMAHLIIALFDQLGLNKLNKFGINANTLRTHLGLSAKAEEDADLDPEERKTIERIKNDLYGTGNINTLDVSPEVDEFLANLYEDNGYMPVDDRQLILGVLRDIDSPDSDSMALLQELMETHTSLDDLIDGITEDTLTGNTPVPGRNDRSPTNGLRTGNTKQGTQDFSPNADDSPEVASWREAQQNGPHTPTIDKLGIDLTLQAANGELGEAFGRDEETRDTVLALYTKKGSAVLVGPPGTGKTALVEGLASKIVNGEYEKLKNYRLVSISVGSMLSGTQYRGALEKNIQDIIKEAKNQNIIIFVDEIHGMIGGGRTTEGATDIANYLKASRDVKWLGATTEGEYTRYFKKDAALNRRFEKIILEEPDRDITKKILAGVTPRLTDIHNVTYTDSALEAVQNYCDRYAPPFRPDREITALDRAGAWANFHGEAAVTAETIIKTLERSLHIPLTKINQNNSSPGALRTALREQIVGQNLAVDTAAKAIFQARTGVNADRPFVMVFAGPTGTGKTELAKAIAKVDGRHFVHINLETIKNLSSLNGAEPGLVGHEKDGMLTGPQKVHPYSVILLDEMEKAPDEVLKALLGLMDEGIMKDSSGEEVSFKNAIIVFTTNFGADQIGKQKHFGFYLGDDSNQTPSGQADLERVKERLSDRLGPETINRFRDFILFDPLTKAELRNISGITLNNVAKQVGERKKITLNFSKNLINQIAEKGFDPASGARAVRRISDELVRGAVARAIMEWPEIDDFQQESALNIDLPTPNIVVVQKGDELLMIPVSDDLRQLHI